MADAPRSDGTARLDEERLAHALISRGLLTREEVQHCRPGTGGEAGPEAFLSRLVAARLLTDNQAKRRQGTGGVARSANPRLSAAGKARPGRDGHRLQGASDEHESPGGRQGAASAFGRQPGVFAASDAQRRIWPLASATTTSSRPSMSVRPALCTTSSWNWSRARRSGKSLRAARFTTNGKRWRSSCRSPRRLQHAAPARPDPSRREAGQHRVDDGGHRQARRPRHGTRDR